MTEYMSEASETSEFKKVSDAVLVMQTKMDNLTTTLEKYIESSEKAATDREMRLRVVEKEVCSIEKIACVESEVKDLETRMYTEFEGVKGRISTLENSGSFSKGFNKVVYVVIGGAFTLGVGLLLLAITQIF